MATARGWRQAGTVGRRWAKRLHGPKWNLAGAGEKEKKNIAGFGLGQIDSWAKMDRRIGMAAEIHFGLIQWFLELKSKGLNIFKPNLNWNQNRIKSNKLFSRIFKYRNLEFGLNIQI
jgi:hypothetical protein